ncbi:MAG: ribosome hibernation-promoting factor, HPF/YfiA family [Nostocoides sp.]
MDIVVTGRHTDVSEKFRRHLNDKLAKVATLSPRTQRVDVVISHEANKRQAKACDKVEITCHAKGKVIRAEACQDDRYAALDVALDKLLERLRRAGDRRRVSRGRRTPESVARASARTSVAESPQEISADSEPEGDGDRFGDSPIEVREKVHESRPMTLEDALQEMELVGHDFFLFQDVETGQPSVVYRRRGWSYGVLHLRLVDTRAAS